MNPHHLKGKQVYLAAPDPERDAETRSCWTHDSEFMRLMHMDPVQPIAPSQVKKQRPAENQGKDQFEFTIRKRSDDRLLGYIELLGINWPNGSAKLQIGIGNPKDRGKGYGHEALGLILAYAFDELNLARLTAITGSYNLAAIRFLEGAHFQIEARQREAINRAGQRWDTIRLGLLPQETEPAENRSPKPPRNQLENSTLVTDIHSPLFQDRLVRLVAPNPETHPPFLAQWSQDLSYLRLYGDNPARPLSAGEIKNELEETGRTENEFTFMIQTLQEARPIGVIALDGIQWTHAEGWLSIGLGEREYWGKGYGTDAMQLMLRYGFAELNLHRISLTVFEYNQRAIRLYGKLGFVHEGCAREFLKRDGRRWDMLFFGLLRSEWESRVQSLAAAAP